jgi:hypothetical protein
MAASRDRVHDCPVAGCSHRATLQPLFHHLRSTHEAEEIPGPWVRQQRDSSERMRRVGTCPHCSMPYINCAQHERTCTSNPRRRAANLESVSDDDVTPDRGSDHGSDDDDAEVPDIAGMSDDEALEQSCQSFDTLLSNEDTQWLEHVMTEEIDIEGIDEGHMITHLLVFSGSTVKRLHAQCRAEYAFIDDMCLKHWVRTRDINALRTWWLLPRLLLRVTERGGATNAAAQVT